MRRLFGSKQDVFYKFSQVLGLLAVSSHNDNQFPLETLRQRQPGQGFFTSIKCQRPYRHKADPHAQRNESDDEIETVQLHRRFNLQVLARHPFMQLFTGICLLINRQPELFIEPRMFCSPGFGKRGIL